MQGEALPHACVVGAHGRDLGACAGADERERARVEFYVLVEAVAVDVRAAAGQDVHARHGGQAGVEVQLLLDYDGHATVEFAEHALAVAVEAEAHAQVAVLAGSADVHGIRLAQVWSQFRQVAEVDLRERRLYLGEFCGKRHDLVDS